MVCVLPCHQRVFNATTALSPDCQVNCIIKALGLLINRHFIKKCEMQCPRNWISNENVHFRTISDLAQHFFNSFRDSFYAELKNFFEWDWKIVCEENNRVQVIDWNSSIPTRFQRRAKSLSCLRPFTVVYFVLKNSTPITVYGLQCRTYYLLSLCTSATRKMRTNVKNLSQSSRKCYLHEILPMAMKRICCFTKCKPSSSHRQSAQCKNKEREWKKF